MKTKTIVRSAVESLARRIPDGVWWRAIRLWLRLLERREPRKALRELFDLETLLTRHIDSAALRMEGGIHPKHRLMRYHDFFVDRLHPGEKVLDLGCGIGAVAHSMAERAGARVLAIDRDGKAIEFAQERFDHPNLTLAEGDVLEMSFDEPVDTIVISNVLEHIEKRVDFLARLQRQVAPRRWLIRVPARERHWTVPMRAELGLPHFNDEDHEIEYTVEELRREVEAADLGLDSVRSAWGEIWAVASPRPAREA